MSNIKDLVTDEFQYTVDDLLVRNKSILDQITKYQDSCSRVNRTIVKSCTQCGCIDINAKKQKYPEQEDFTPKEAQDMMSTHLEGKLCDNCRYNVEKEIGRNLFYLASICNSLDLNLYDILVKEMDRIKMLGKYNLR